jgi:Zn-dependent peptidase ImmA (M78 family)/transcriptional regulator with XRE-family HTH domain
MKVIEFGSMKSNKIVPSKLKEARVARALSLAQLSKLIGISSQAISQFEKGETKPSPQTLVKLIETLDFPINFFCSNYNENVEDELIYFRSNKNITKKLKDACKSRIAWVEKMYLLVESYFQLPKLDLPKFEEFDVESIDNGKIEEITLKVRKYWGLDQSPIDNLIDILQSKGFVITKLKIGTKKIDAFSVWKNGVPYIFLGDDKESATRLRFDLAHELAHLLIHKYVDKEELEEDKELYNKIEEQANYFASAFLLPIEAFNKEVISSSIDSFILLKKRWKVSISAMIKRCQNANILTDNQIRYLNSQMIRYGYYREEPLDEEIKKENPYLFKQAFEILVDNNIYTKESILEKLELNRGEAIELYSLDKSFFDKSDNILKLIK